jgi:predicted amidohydrolase YtcJ
MNTSIVPDLILHNGHITTLDPKYPEARNLAIKDGRIIGVDDAEEYQRGPETKVIDLQGRRVIPGLNDSHLHVIRGGLNYNMELRWDGVPSLADALRMLRNRRSAPRLVNGCACCRRLDGISICRTPDADVGRNQRRRA